MKGLLREWARWIPVALPAFALSACLEGDPGPAGPPGTTECFSCHSDDFEMANYLLPYQEEYEVSQHALGDTYVRRTPPCSRCHTNEGFQAYLDTGVEANIASSSKIQCFTCHAPHSNRDFSLRQMGPVQFEVQDVFTSTETYDRGSSNTCAVCHQARPANPPIADNAVVTSSRWGPHHATQSNIIRGTSAWVFPGASYNSGTVHYLVEKGCVECHMAAPDGDSGGHTFRVADDGDININSCVACHQSWLSSDDGTLAVETTQAEFKTELNKIQDELFLRNWITSNDPDVLPRVVTGTYANANDLGAIWNFLLLWEDHSLGVHNPRYASDVLEATKAYLGIP